MANRFHDFFYDSEEGQAYIAALESLIAHKHAKAEDNPDLAVSFTQHAKGIREAIKQARTMSTDIKKPSNEEQQT